MSELWEKNQRDVQESEHVNKENEQTKSEIVEESTNQNMNASCETENENQSYDFIMKHETPDELKDVEHENTAANQEYRYHPMTGEPMDTTTSQTTASNVEQAANAATAQGTENETYDYYHISGNQIPNAREHVNGSEGAKGMQMGGNPNMYANRAARRRKKTVSPTFKKWRSCVAMALVFGLVAGGTMWGVNTLGNKISGTDSSAQVPKVETATTVSTTGDGVTQTSSTGGYSVTQVAKNSMPSIVAITNKSVQEVQSWFGGQTQQYESESSGSGIIVGQNDEELLIATNNHVISGANTLSVAFADNEVAEAQIKGTDSDNDLAVIAVKIADIKEETLSTIKVIQLGDSESLEVGEQVVAIGNALGYGQSVTGGYVSALNREVTVEDVTSTLIQTDAAINPGNSGGALLNMKGELIGINAAKFASSEVEGMGYAIPVATAKPILDDLMNRKTRYKVDEDKASYLGISARNVSSETAQMYGMPQGVYVAEVTENGPAEAAGLKKGDVITKIDGSTVSSYDELVNDLQYYEAGEKIEVVIARASDGEYTESTVEVTLGKKSDMPESNTSSNQQQGGNTAPEEQYPNQDQQGQIQIPDISDLLP